MADHLTRLRAAIDAIHLGDRELAEELMQVRTRAEGRLAGGPPGALEAPLPGMPAGGPAGTGMLETIVLRTGRPVLAVVHDKPRLVFDDPDSMVWKRRLVEAEEGLVHAIRAVGRIELKGNPDYAWVGTGWLVDRDVVVTNRHVADVFGRYSGNEFVFRPGIGGPMEASIDFLKEVDREDSLVFHLEKIMHIEDEPGPDMAFLRVKSGSGRELPDRIALARSMPEPQRFVAVIGYPARDSRIPDQDLMERIFGDVYDKKRLAPGQIRPSEDGLVLHDCSTLGGNSGSVVLDLSSGEAVALHFSGRYLTANYAVPSHLVAERLEGLNGRGPRPPRKRGEGAGTTGPPGGGGVLATPIASGGGQRRTYMIPIHVEVEVGAPVAGALGVAPSADAAEDPDLVLAEAAPIDYSNRDGYAEGFLGPHARVSLPDIARKKDVLKFNLGSKQASVLKYEHFSVVMNRPRRMCFFSAVNINGKTSRKMARRGWRFDTRIPPEAQIMKECYGSAPKFSRGHMTRREDPIWGPKAEASRGNDDSMHATNAVPQMQPFNAPVWLGLEDYALEHAREDRMRISVMTGPFFRDDDPVLFKVRVPRSFWKVIAFIHDKAGKLCATGYTMSQDEFLAQPEFVFGQYTTRQHKTTQVALRTIEQKAGLSFGKLADHDPLGKIEGLAERPLSDFEQIRFL